MARFFIYAPGLWNAVIVLAIVAPEGCISWERLTPGSFFSI